MIAIPFSTETWPGPPVTRFAPSPNGRLHLGHALSALMAHDVARLGKGRYLVRIEDIDAARSRPKHVEAILEDLAWLGLAGDEAPLFQSSRLAAYEAAFGALKAHGIVYRCFCSRSEIAEALKHISVLHGPDGPAYPGTCRRLSKVEAERRAAVGEPHCWRIRMDDAMTSTGALAWREAGQGTIAAELAGFGDVVLWRKDAPASYHLAVTIDDAHQGIDPVVRGQDLYAYTAVHRLLQTLLDLPEPTYWHHPLLLGADHEKLAKSADSPALGELRAAGRDPTELIVALRAGRLPDGISLSGA